MDGQLAANSSKWHHVVLDIAIFRFITVYWQRRHGSCGTRDSHFSNYLTKRNLHNILISTGNEISWTPDEVTITPSIFQLHMLQKIVVQAWNWLSLEGSPKFSNKVEPCINMLKMYVMWVGHPRARPNRAYLAPIMEDNPCYRQVRNSII